MLLGLVSRGESVTASACHIAGVPTQASREGHEDGGQDRSSSTGTSHSSEDPRPESTQIANEDRRRDSPLLNVIVAGLGTWVLLSPFVFTGIAVEVTLNNVFVGAIIAAGGLYNYYRVQNDVPLSVAVASLLALLGVWLLVAAPLLEMPGMLFWSTAAAGILVTFLSGYSTYEARAARAVVRQSEQ